MYYACVHVFKGTCIIRSAVELMKGGGGYRYIQL